MNTNHFERAKTLIRVVNFNTIVDQSGYCFCLCFVFGRDENFRKIRDKNFSSKNKNDKSTNRLKLSELQHSN